MSYNVINTNTYFNDEAKASLEKAGCAITHIPLDRLNEKDLCQVVRGVDAAIAGGEGWTETVLASADRLKIVARTGAGFDRVDLAAASRRKIWVTNTPGATAFAVADLAMGLMLCLLRNIFGLAADLKRGVWSQFCGRELGELTVGIVGTGAIGRQVIQRLNGFGSTILAYDTMPDAEFAKQARVRYVSLDELLAAADVVSLHCPLTQETKGLIGRRELALMKKDSYLVNTSRAAVVDRAALVGALKTRTIAGAATDVHDQAPCRPDDELVALENVLATPFVAYRTQESISHMCNAAAREVVAVLKGQLPQHPVNRI